MHNSYQDIRSRIAGPPSWWDENGTPRYGLFTPDKLAYIYADECALVMIACQNCGKEFMVAFSAAQHREFMSMMPGATEADFEACKNTLAKSIRAGTLHFGDPPNVDCCPGAAMNCLDLMVLEYWRRNDLHLWERNRSLEIELPEFAEHKGATNGSNQSTT